VETVQFASQASQHFNLIQKCLIQILNINLDIRARLVYLIKISHLILHNADNLIDMSPVGRDKSFLLLQNRLNDLFMVIAKLLCTESILLFQVFLSRHTLSKLRMSDWTI